RGCEGPEAAGDRRGRGPGVGAGPEGPGAQRAAQGLRARQHLQRRGVGGEGADRLAAAIEASPPARVTGVFGNLPGWYPCATMRTRFPQDTTEDTTTLGSWWSP